MPFVRVTLFEGRSSDKKRLLVEEVTRAVASVCEIAPETVEVLIEESSRENWSRGGVLYSERDTRPHSDSDS